MASWPCSSTATATWRAYDFEGNGALGPQLAEGLRAVCLPVDLQQQPAAVRRQALRAGAAARCAGGGPRPAGRKNESYLLAMDPATGKSLWRHVRPSEACENRARPSPRRCPANTRAARRLLIVGGDAITGHDPATGRELWRWGDWNPQQIRHWRLVPSPVAGDGVMLVCAPKREPVYAIKAGGHGALGRQGRGLDQPSRTATSRPTCPPRPSTTAISSCSATCRNCLSRVEPQTGKVKWTVPTPGRSQVRGLAAGRRRQDLPRSTSPARWPCSTPPTAKLLRDHPDGPAGQRRSGPLVDRRRRRPALHPHHPGAVLHRPKEVKSTTA